MSKKTSTEKIVNHDWQEDTRNPKMLINLPKLFNAHLDSESNKFFAGPKCFVMRKYMERGYVPNTIMSDISKAYDDYQLLKIMFNLK
jgi:hypothetical protein